MKHIDFEIPNFGEFTNGPQTKLAYANEVLADNPVAYWRLGETSGIVAKNEIDATQGIYHGGVSLNETGAVGFDDDAAASFDGGNDYVDTNLDDTLDVTGNLTLEAWIRADDLDTSSHIASKNDVGGASLKCPWQWALLAGGTMRFFAGDVQSGVTIVVDSMDALTEGTWHHIAVVREGSQITFFIDAVQDSSGWQSFSGTPAGNTVTAKLACRGDGGAQFFPGRLDEVAVYSHALTFERIKAHYRAGVAR